MQINMKRFLLLTLMTVIALPSFSQGRLLESSSEKRPLWVKHDVERYDVLKISMESTVSLEDAKAKAFDGLRNLVINNTTTYMLKVNYDGREAEEIMNDVRNSDFVRNISEYSAIETYWEHRLIKRQDVYIYYILYEFNDFEKKKISLEIDKADSGTLDKLNNL